MKSSQKVALSLLIAIVVFSGFTVLAFSGLFHYIEVTFYNPRVKQNSYARLDRAVSAIENYHSKNKIRFEKILQQPAIKSIYQANQSAEDIQGQEALFGALKSELTGFMFVRFIGNQGQRLHYSTLPGDIQSQTAGQIVYKAPGDIGGAMPLSTLALPQNTPYDLLEVPEDNTFIYRFLVSDTYGVVQGTALFYVSVRGLANELLADGTIDIGSSPDIITHGAVVLNVADRFGKSLSDAVAAAWTPSSASATPSLKNPDGGSFVIFSREVQTGGYALLLVPESDFRMVPLMQWVLLAGTFLTAFLLMFLILNVRQDSVLVLSDRIKRFQIQLLQEYLENKDELDWRRWQVELEQQRDDVSSQIKRGIGRLHGKRGEELDRLINRSWDEILTVLGTKVAEPRNAPVDIARLEAVIQRAFGNLKPSDIPQAVFRQTLPSSETRSPAPATGVAGDGTAASVAELSGDVEDLEEIEELEDVAEVETAEVVGDRTAGHQEAPSSRVTDLPRGVPIQVEEIEEDEDLEEVEAVDELEEDLEPVGETEASEEPVENAASDRGSPETQTITSGMRPVEVEELEEADSLAEAEMIEEAAPAEPEAAEPVEELEEVEEAEEVEETEEVEEAEEAEETEEVEEAEEVAETEEVAEVASAAKQDVPEVLPSEAPVAIQAETVEEDEIEFPDFAAVVLDELDLRVPDQVLEAGADLHDARHETRPEQAAFPAASDRVVPAAEEIEEFEELEEIEEVEEAEEAEELGELEALPADAVSIDESPAVESVVEAAEDTQAHGIVRDVEPVDDLEAEDEEDSFPVEAIPISGAGLFMASKLSFGGRLSAIMGEDFELAELSSAESADGAEPVDYVEEVEPVGAKVAGAQSEDEHVDYGLGNLDPDAYSVRPMQEILDLLVQNESFFVESDGVYQIQPSAYSRAASARHAEKTGTREFRHLAHSVMQAGKTPAADDQGGIDEILSIHAIDLFPAEYAIDRADADRVSPVSSNEDEQLRFTEKGLDYDWFLRRYRQSESGIVKSLVEITRLFRSRAGSIFLDGDKGYRATYSLGLDEACMNRVIAKRDSLLYQNVLRQGRALFLSVPLNEVSNFRSVCEENQFSLLQKSLFLPITFQGSPAYLLLSVSNEIQDMEGVFASLMTRQTAGARS